MSDRRAGTAKARIGCPLKNAVRLRDRARADTRARRARRAPVRSWRRRSAAIGRDQNGRRERGEIPRCIADRFGRRTA